MIYLHSMFGTIRNGDSDEGMSRETAMCSSSRQQNVWKAMQDGQSDIFKSCLHMW